MTQHKVTWRETEIVVTEFEQVLDLPDRGDMDDLEWIQTVSDVIGEQAKYEVPPTGVALYLNGEFVDGQTEDVQVTGIEYVK